MSDWPSRVARQIVGKALLLRHEPLAGFATEFDRLSFAEAVALRLRCPALDGLLSHELTNSLNNYLKSRTKKAPGNIAWRDHVSQVRIITSETRLQARIVTILVFEDLRLSPEQQAVWRSWFRENRKMFADRGLTIDKMLFNTLDGYTARHYKDSIPLRLPALLASPTW